MSEITQFKHVVIQGVGLIGGSVAAAVRQRWPGCRITGLGRSAARLEAARTAGLLHDWVTSPEQIDADPQAVVVVCLPVHLIATAVHELTAVCPNTVLITDAGSVKNSIQQAVDSQPRSARQYVGAHPIAGSEQTGYEFADANLFVDRACIVTPQTEAGSSHNDRCVAFWKGLGARVSCMSPEEHDRVLALTSHVPHLVASALVAALQPSDHPYTGTGFRDTTRVAAGDAGLWQQILCGNADEVTKSIARLQQVLSRFSDALTRQDDQTVYRLLDEAAVVRQSLQNHLLETNGE